MIIDKKSEIDKFIEDIIPLLHNYADIYLSQSIKNFNKTRKINYSVGVKVTSNFLELDFSSTDLDKGEIIDMLNQYLSLIHIFSINPSLLNDEKLHDEIIKDIEAIRDSKIVKLEDNVVENLLKLANEGNKYKRLVKDIDLSLIHIFHL